MEVCIELHPDLSANPGSGSWADSVIKASFSILASISASRGIEIHCSESHIYAGGRVGGLSMFISIAIDNG